MNSFDVPQPRLGVGLRANHHGRNVEGKPAADRLAANDNGQATHRLARLRAQAAVVRTLADHVDHFSPLGGAADLSEQLIEEMARLGCGLLDAAASMASENGFFAAAISSEIESSTAE